MRINQNMAALTSYRNLTGVDNQLTKSLERLSSGLRINHAADDAAGSAISEKMTAQVKGLSQASRNAQDGISLIQTAEGGMAEVESILQKMRELTVQAANDPLTSEDRGYITDELTSLTSEITRIASDTEFNGQKLLDGTFEGTDINFQIGANNGQVITLQLADVSATGVSGTGLAISVDVTDNATSNATLDNIDAAIKTINTQRSNLGATQNRLEHTVSNLSVGIENLTAARSRIQDVDMAAEMMSYTKNQILSQAGTAMLAQANQKPQTILQLLR